MKKNLPLLTAILLVVSSGTSSAFVATITASNPRAVYLRVGDGAYSGTAAANGTPQNLATINLVSTVVPAAQVGNGTPQTMTSNATQAQSFYDNFAFCNLPNEVYIGGFYRRNGTTGSATLTVTAPASLLNTQGDSININQISWTSSGNQDGNAVQPIPAGTYSSGATVVANFPVNTWRESCHSFQYANSAVVGSGDYTARITYTLTAL